MQITKEQLEKELARLTQSREQHLANANALAGAMELTATLIRQLDAPEPEAKAETKKE